MCAMPGHTSIGSIARTTWRELWSQAAGRIAVMLFVALTLIYVFELGSSEWRIGLSTNLDRVLLPLIIVLLAFRLTKVTGTEARRFWTFVLGGTISWFIAGMLYMVSALALRPHWLDLSVDIGYIVYYLCLYLAADQQPQLARGWSRRDVIFPFSMAAATLFIVIMFGYFVVVPWAMAPGEYGRYLVSFNLYVTLDLILALRFGLLLRASRDPRWQRGYLLLTVASLAMAAGDLVEGLGLARIAVATIGSRIDIVWLIPHFCVAVVVITVAGRPSNLGGSAGTVGSTDQRVQSLLPFYAFTLPVIHFGLYLLNYLDPGLRTPREAIVLSGLVVFAVVSLLQQIWLERTVASLRSDLVVRALDDRLRQSQRLESVGRLAGGVAHDLNNLLMVIKSYAELANLRLSGEDHDTRARLAEIDRAADRAADLIRQLLAFGRQQVLNPEVVSVNDQVRGLEGMLSRILGDDIDLVVDLDPEAGFTKVDPGLLEQVVVNLAVNARDAMPRGGRLTISTQPERHAAHGTGGHLRGSGYVELAVSDTGFGIDPGIRDRIFEPYFTTKEMEKGTGLGLATVYGIVDQSGGEIEVESELGRGSTFIVRLPRTSERPAERAPSGKPTQHVVGGETVLLTEDEATIREPLAEYLEHLGLDVLQAVDGIDALEVAEGYGGNIDVLVTDLVMPRMSGPDLARNLLAERPGLKVVYVSGYTPEAMQTYGGAGEIDAIFLQKPFLLEDLATTIRQALDR